MRIQGDLELQLTIKPEAPTATIVAYLMDCDPATGTARIITHAPYTITNGRPGEARTITFPLQPAHYALNQGRQLQLIIDSHDKFFADANPIGTTIEFTSPQHSESYIDIPLHPLT